MWLLEEKINTPVDVEFASDGDNLFILQCRPQSQSRGTERKPIPEKIPKNRQIFSAKRYVTTNQIENIEYIVFVKPDEYVNLPTREKMQKVADVINDLNQKLPRRKFILMGPGRWGSRGDIKLGVPVKYGDINNTTLLVEIAKKKGEYTPELSFGTHFFQDLVEADIRYLPLYPDETDIVFNERILLTAKNHLETIAPRHKSFAEVVRLIRVSDLIDGGTLSIIMDGEANQALAYLNPPDHWSWRLHKTYELGEKLSAKEYGIEAMYLVGSTKTGTAGPGSDIDIIIHFKGSIGQKERLMDRLTQEDRLICKENEEKTGNILDSMLDVHFVTDEDIKKRSSWASHITSPYMSVKKIPLKK